MRWPVVPVALAATPGRCSGSVVPAAPEVRAWPGPAVLPAATPGMAATVVAPDGSSAPAGWAATVVSVALAARACRHPMVRAAPVVTVAPVVTRASVGAADISGCTWAPAQRCSPKAATIPVWLVTAALAAPGAMARWAAATVGPVAAAATSAPPASPSRAPS